MDSPEEEEIREIPREVIEHDAAVKIQKVFKGWWFRRQQKISIVQHNAARKIQAVWKKHRVRQLFKRLKEAMATTAIRRAVARYNTKLKVKKQYRKLATLDPVLTFYPARSQPPANTRTRRRKKGGGGGGGSTTGRSSGRKLKKQKTEAAVISVAQLHSMPMPLMVSAAGAGGSRKKRKILVELPPPWHGKDPRRLSATQKDEMLYEQKNDLAWVKGDLMKYVMRRIGEALDKRDELFEKNEKFLGRMVPKPFLFPVIRNKIHNMESSPKVLQYLRDIGVYVLLSSTFFMVCEIKTFSDDNVVTKNIFDIPAPLYDVAIHSKSGYIIGLDNRWCLRLFNGGATVMQKQLDPKNKIPVVNKFMKFDRYGLLWVNLIPQKGDFMCFDPLTLSMTILVKLDSIGTVHRFMRSNVTLLPLTLREPIGFVGSFAGMTDLVLFSLDFGRAKHLKHPKMTSFPSIRQIGGRLFVWSSDKVVYIYEVRESIDLVQLVGSFEVDAVPVDVCCTNDPDLIFVGLEDCTLRVFLGGKMEVQLRLPESKMTRLELQFADAILGPMTYTKSRPSYGQVLLHKFSAVPLRIDAFAVSPRLAIVTAAYSDSSIQSMWVFNDAQNVRAADFDSFEYDNGGASHQLMTKEFQAHIVGINRKRNSFFELSKFLEDFDAAATKGTISNIFQPKAAPFVLTKFISGVSLQDRFPFIPETGKDEHSAYETFQFLRRCGALPAQMYDFGSFVQRLVPNELHRNVTMEGRVNQMIPVRTSGVYDTIVSYAFKDQQINELVRNINPVSCLKERLSVFTLTSVQANIIEKGESKGDRAVTVRAWINAYEKGELHKRLGSMSILEDAVKHELMKRVQRNISKAFQRNQLDKMVPVPPTDIHQHFNSNDCKKIHFVDKSNRNPLLDQSCHMSIYHTWANRLQFGRDTNLYIDLRALFIPSGVFGDSIVQDHFELVRRVAMSSKRITHQVYSFLNAPDGSAQVVITDDAKALPLSYFLKVHSFLGGNSRLLLAARSILSKVLTLVYQLHKNGIILRTLIPANILLNAQTGTVSLGGVFDCQQIGTSTTKANYLPLPPAFAVPSNPFLPPEYFHEGPRRHTTAFDVWQFGVLLLYVLTGFLPPAYGTELLKHMEDAKRITQKRVKLTGPTSELDDPPLYPRINFFYDWLKGCPIYVMKDGERNVWTGDMGECFITTERSGTTPSILELDHYKLLPYKNTKLKYDEARLFLEIIASCLQIDPEKRPTIEQLLRTIPFNQANQLGDILEQYMKQPTPVVFVREFFEPSLSNMPNGSFPFTLGIIAALVFHEEMADEDAGYSFPLDSRAAEQVIEALFNVQFIDQLVVFVLNRIEKKITYGDVNPTIQFNDDTFTGLLKLFERFINAVEHGHGSLLQHVDEVVMSLLALYTSNPYLRHSSEYLLANKEMTSKLATTGSAALFVFTHTHVKDLVRFALKGSSYIINTLKRTTEHNDGYFKQFISFGESVYSLASAMCHSIEKQRMNAIILMESLWNYGQTTHIIRLFVDFRVPQMIIHCLMNSSARLNALEFINDAMVAIRLRSFEPTYMLLHRCVNRCTVMHFCSMMLKNEDEEIRQQTVNIVHRIVFGDSAAAIASLFANDILSVAMENSKDRTVGNSIIEILCFSSPFVFQIIQSSQTVRRLLKQIGFEADEQFDFSTLVCDMDIATALERSKRLAATLFIRQSSLPDDIKSQKPPLAKATDFLMRTINQALEEADWAAACLDNEVNQATRFDLKGTTFLKAKNTARTTDFHEIRTLITQLCDVLLHLFRCLCFYWRAPGCDFPRHLFRFILDKMQAPIPKCESMPHPAYLVHHCLQRMAMHTLVDLPDNSPVRSAMVEIEEVWPKVMFRDIMYVMQCVDKDVVEIQLLTRYPEERRIRQKMFQTICIDRHTTNMSPLLRFVVGSMLYNKIQFKTSALAQKYKCPIRSEAVSMVMFLLAVRDKYEMPAKRLVDELLISNFLEEEKKLTSSDDAIQFVDSSIALLKMVVQCKSLFEDRTLKIAQVHLEHLCAKFSREGVSPASYDDGTPREAKPMKAQSRTPSRPRPKLRALTNLGGAMPPQHGTLLGTSLQGSPSMKVAATKTSRSRMATSRMAVERHTSFSNRRPQTSTVVKRRQTMPT